MLSTFRTLGNTFQLFTCLEKQPPAQHTHSPRAALPPPINNKHVIVAAPETTLLPYLHTHAQVGLLARSSCFILLNEQPCLCPCSVALLPPVHQSPSEICPGGSPWGC